MRKLHPRYRRTERASALMLVPAGILVLIILGAIACDSALAFMGQRELQNLAEATANDAATAAAPSAEYATGGKNVVPSNDQLAAFVDERFTASPMSGLTIDSHAASIDPNGQVTVQARGHVNYLFARAIPGLAHSQAVVASAASNLSKSD